ncbi:MAG TPA: type II toxin-antitoxin system PemK/MazF family toxin [Acidimicrobiales bacterium]|nr:type II toxin-antitoxin system PemK/MazF family toxin [Acidimicrobiales bacterium]
MVNRGEVWWAESPNDKRRPYLVITRQASIPVLKTLIAVPATRRVRGIPSEVALDEADGMPEPCALSFDNVATIPKAWMVERICRLGPERLHEICRVLSIATECSW